MPRISVIVPVYNQVNLLRRCLRSLAAQTAPDLQVIVVDDASPEDPAPVLSECPGAELIRLRRNAGYAAANNAGLARAAGELLVFLNSDTELPERALQELAACLAERPGIAGVHPVHLGPDGAVQRMCLRFPTLRIGLLWDSWLQHRAPSHPVLRDYTMADWDFQSEREVEHAATSCLMIRREVFDRIGGMDPDLVLFYNDADYCLRMREAGYRILYWPGVRILHHGGVSVGTASAGEMRVYADRYRFFRKWFGWRGGAAVRCAVWSRFLYEAAGELVHGHFRRTGRKLRTGLRLNQAMRGAP